MTRRFRFFANKEDLENIFTIYQEILDIYYTPTYADAAPFELDDIKEIPNLGTNIYGSHIGNNQFRIAFQSIKCIWEEYQCTIDKNTKKTRYTTLTDENNTMVDIDFGGIHQDTNIFPTEVGTIHYENEYAKKLYNELKKIIRKMSVCTINGYYICQKAYENRDCYRFCTISINSPSAYDLIVK